MHPQGRTCHEQGRRGILQAPSFRPCVQIAQTGTTLLLGQWGHCAKTNPPAQWSVAVWVFWACTVRQQVQESPRVCRM